MRVFVINKRGQALMPCSTRKARLLLGEKVKEVTPTKIKILDTRKTILLEKRRDTAIHHRPK